MGIPRAALTALLAAAALAAGSAWSAGGAAAQADATVTGTVYYLERIALPPTAVVTVRLVDVSRADAPGDILAEQRIAPGDRQPPIPFTLAYDPARIDPRFSYAVQARIEVDGQLWFISTDRYAVITQGNPTQIEVRVRRTGGNGGGTDPTALPATGGGGGDTGGGTPHHLVLLALVVALAGWALRARAWRATS